MSSEKPRADVMDTEPTGTPLDPSAYGRGVEAATLVGLLADPTRLKVVAALALGAVTLQEVSDAADLPLKDVALAARRLARAGLVRRDGAALRLRAEQFGAGAPAARRPAGAGLVRRDGAALELRAEQFGAAARAAAEAAPPPQRLSDDPVE